jgi:hypothetical protein
VIVDDEPSWLRRLFNWLIRRDHASSLPPPTRDELMAAREQLQRQIEILNASPIYSRAGPSQTPMLLAELTAELGEIDEEVARIDRFSPLSEPRRPFPPSE